MTDDLDIAQLTAIQHRISELPTFFVGGMPRSGTTWLQQMLNAYPSILCLGESRYVNEVVPQLLKVMETYGEGRAVSRGTWAPTVAGPSLDQIRPLLRTAFTCIAAANLGERPVDQLLAVGEKTPDNLFNLGKLRFAYPESRFLNIVRDPRDGALSGFIRFRARLAKDLKREDYVVEYARLWNQRIRDARRFFEDGRPYYELTYENLLTNTEAQLTDVLGFLGVPVEAPSVAAALDASSFETLSGGRTRGDEDAASHYRRGQAGGWRDDLSERERSGVLNMAGDLMAEFGYET